MVGGKSNVVCRENLGSKYCRPQLLELRKEELPYIQADLFARICMAKIAQITLELSGVLFM